MEAHVVGLVGYLDTGWTFWSKLRKALRPLWPRSPDTDLVWASCSWVHLGEGTVGLWRVFVTLCCWICFTSHRHLDTQWGMDLNLGFLWPCVSCLLRSIKGSTKGFWALCLPQKIRAPGSILMSTQAKLFDFRTSAGGRSCHHPLSGTCFQAE